MQEGLVEAGIQAGTGDVIANELIARFEVGDLRCVALRDGYVDTPIFILAPEVPPAELRAFLTARGHEGDALRTPMTCLLVERSDGSRMLIDSGLGKVRRPGGPPTDHVGKLLECLDAAGVEPASIGDVLVSHIHPDHIGGLFNGEGQPIFPDATIHVPRAEVEFWGQEQPDLSGTLMPPPAQGGVIAVAKRFLALAGDLAVLFDAGQEVIEGVQALALPGHTPGQVGFLIDGGSQSMFFSADAAGHHQVSIERPEWRFANDSDSPLAIRTRKDMLALLAEKGWTTYTPHFPWPGMGHFTHTADGIRWQAMR